MNVDEMQPQNRAFFDRLDFSGWEGTAGRTVDSEDRGMDSALDQLRRQTEDIISEYEERSSFTADSKERRDAHQKAVYEQKKRAAGRPKGRGSS